MLKIGFICAATLTYILVAVSGKFEFHLDSHLDEGTSFSLCSEFCGFTILIFF